MSDMYAMYPAEWAEPDPEYPAPKAACNEICAEVAALKDKDDAHEAWFREWTSKNLGWTWTNQTVWRGRGPAPTIDDEQESKQ